MESSRVQSFLAAVKGVLHAFLPAVESVRGGTLAGPYVKRPERKGRRTVSENEEIEAIQSRLTTALESQNKRLTIIAALSIASTTAHMIGMSKLDLQKKLMRCYDARLAEAKPEVS